jgi:hypothetical protein
MIETEHVASLLDDYLHASLAPADAHAVESHLDRCAPCRAELRELQSLRLLLAHLPAPSPRPGLLERMLTTAVRDPMPPPPMRLWQRPIWYTAGLAAAAGLLAVGFVLGMQIAGRKGAGPQVMLVAQPMQLGPTVRRVGLMFRASGALKDTSISVWLPDDVQIAGRPNVRELSWRTDLKSGANLLELPLLATGTRSGTLVVRLSQGSLVRTLEVPIAVRRPKDPGAASVSVRDASALT